MSFASQTLVFGALFGSTFSRADGSQDTGILWMYMLAVLIGLSLAVLKNARIADPRRRLRISVADLGVALAGLILVAMLPAFLGLIRGLFLTALAGAYYQWYQKALAPELAE